MTTTPCLDRGLLVRGDHVLILGEFSAIEDPFVEVEDDAGLLREVGIAREDPRAVAPGPDDGIGEDAPDRRSTDSIGDLRTNDFRRDLRAGEATERQVPLRRQLT